MKIVIFLGSGPKVRRAITHTVVRFPTQPKKKKDVRHPCARWFYFNLMQPLQYPCNSLYP